MGIKTAFRALVHEVAGIVCRLDTDQTTTAAELLALRQNTTARDAYDWLVQVLPNPTRLPFGKAVHLALRRILTDPGRWLHHEDSTSSFPTPSDSHGKGRSKCTARHLWAVLTTSSRGVNASKQPIVPRLPTTHTSHRYADAATPGGNSEDSELSSDSEESAMSELEQSRDPSPSPHNPAAAASWPDQGRPQPTPPLHARRVRDTARADSDPSVTPRPVPTTTLRSARQRLQTQDHPRVGGQIRTCGGPPQTTPAGLSPGPSSMSQLRPAPVQVDPPRQELAREQEPENQSQTQAQPPTQVHVHTHTHTQTLLDPNQVQTGPQSPRASGRQPESISPNETTSKPTTSQPTLADLATQPQVLKQFVDGILKSLTDPRGHLRHPVSSSGEAYRAALRAVRKHVALSSHDTMVLDYFDVVHKYCKTQHPADARKARLMYEAREAQKRATAATGKKSPPPPQPQLPQPQRQRPTPILL